MLSAERQQRILEFLREHRAASIAELTEMLDASSSTVNRDLSVLAAEGWLRRVRGGASITTGLSADPPAKLERLRQIPEKEAIATAAARLVEPGEVVFLEASTTILHLAHRLRNVRPLTTVTNDVFIAAELADASDIEVIVTGGSLRRSTRALVGPLTEQAIDGIHVDKVFTGISALHLEHGLSTGDLTEAQIKQRLLRSGEQIIGLADHTKFNKIAFSKLGPIAQLTTLVTDELTSADDLDRIRDMGVRVIVAPKANVAEAAGALLSDQEDQ